MQMIVYPLTESILATLSPSHVKNDLLLTNDIHSMTLWRIEWLMLRREVMPRLLAQFFE